MRARLLFAASLCCFFAFTANAQNYEQQIAFMFSAKIQEAVLANDPAKLELALQWLSILANFREIRLTTHLDGALLLAHGSPKMVERLILAGADPEDAVCIIFDVLPGKSEAERASLLSIVAVLAEYMPEEAPNLPSTQARARADSDGDSPRQDHCSEDSILMCLLRTDLTPRGQVRPVVSARPVPSGPVPSRPLPSARPAVLAPRFF